MDDKCIANLGDVNPVDHGGLFVFPDEMVKLEEPADDGTDYDACTECGGPAFLTETEVSHHGYPDDIDHDADARHVAILPKPPEWEVYRVSIDRLQEVKETEGGTTYVWLVPASYAPDWPHVVSQYQEWFTDSLPDVESACDFSDLREALCSADPVKRAQAYRAILDFHGWTNGDAYPVKIERKEAEEMADRYLKEIASE